MVTVGRICGLVVGNYMTEKSLAIAFFAGHPEVALIWAIAKSIPHIRSKHK